MRYRGQGHEIEVPVAGTELGAPELEELRATYERRYAELYARYVPDMEIEILNWAVVASTATPPVTLIPGTDADGAPSSDVTRILFFGRTDELTPVPAFLRTALLPGDRVVGPALINEAQTTTYVAPDYDATIDAGRNIVLTRNGST
jgi:N-methylhydantoinase A